MIRWEWRGLYSGRTTVGCRAQGLFTVLDVGLLGKNAEVHRRICYFVSCVGNSDTSTSLSWWSESPTLPRIRYVSQIAMGKNPNCTHELSPYTLSPKPKTSAKTGTEKDPRRLRPYLAWARGLYRDRV